MNERGLTLLEVVVAMVILAIGLLAIVPGMIHLSDVADGNEVRSAAVQAAQQSNERTRRLDPASLPTTGSSAADTVTIGEHTFQVVQHYCRDTSMCLAFARHITTEVSFDGQVVYSTQTVFTRLQ